MTEKEKLIELLDEVHKKPLGKEYRERLGNIADHLIDNGVTFREDVHWATEQAYKNGYEDGKKDAVVHGRWIDNTDERGFLCNAWRKCSVCGGLNYSKRPPYCPNCGEKMDEPPKGE